MLLMIFILLFILEGNGVVVPQVAWIIASIFAGITVINIVIKTLEKLDKHDKNE